MKIAHNNLHLCVPKHGKTIPFNPFIYTYMYPDIVKRINNNPIIVIK